MMSTRRRIGEAFERRLHSTGLHRLRVKWWDWRAKKGRPPGDLIMSPQWPAPFGPPTYRAIADDGSVVIRPADERWRPKWLACLCALAAWDGEFDNDAGGHRNWLRVPEARRTAGSYVIFEQIDGIDNAVYRLAAIDGGEVPLTDLVLETVKSSWGKIDDAHRAIEARSTEHEIVTAGPDGKPEIRLVRRTPEQREWRANAEDQIKEVDEYGYHRRFSAYQYDPAIIAEGIEHPSGFKINDKRSIKRSGLLEAEAR